MDDILQLTLLYDFYGELLTEKQKQVYELHYQNDLSLTEIGEEIIHQPAGCPRSAEADGENPSGL